MSDCCALVPSNKGEARVQEVSLLTLFEIQEQTYCHSSRDSTALKNYDSNEERLRATSDISSQESGLRRIILQLTQLQGIASESCQIISIREEFHLLVTNPKNKWKTPSEVQHFSSTNQGFYLAASKAQSLKPQFVQFCTEAAFAASLFASRTSKLGPELLDDSSFSSTSSR